jgi:hypothetical protein
MPPPDYTHEGAGVSRADGSGMREIGSVPGEWAPAGLSTMKWLPDGKRMAFFYRHGMYVRPVD